MVAQGVFTHVQFFGDGEALATPAAERWSGMIWCSRVVRLAICALVSRQVLSPAASPDIASMSFPIIIR